MRGEVLCWWLLRAIRVDPEGASFLVKRIDFVRQIGLEIRVQGEVAERLKAPDWKSCIQLNLYRGFESLSLRQFIQDFMAIGMRTRAEGSTKCTAFRTFHF